MRWEHHRLTRAQLARVTSTRPLVRRLALRMRALGSSANRGNGSPPSSYSRMSRFREVGSGEPPRRGAVAGDVGCAVVAF